MGLFSGLKKLTKKFLKPIARTVAPIIGGPAGAIIGGVIGGGIQPMTPPGRARPPVSLLPQVDQPFRVPPITRLRPPGTLPGLTPISPFPITPSPSGITGTCPVGYHLAKDGSGRCVRNRRMNVLNHKAAMRAIRRIKGARKMLMKIERQLPQRRAPRRAVRHRRELIHTE